MESKMATKFSASQMRVLKRQGITVLVVLVFFGSYFLIRVPAQRAFYVERSFAALSRMSARIESAIENTIRNGRNAVNDASVAESPGPSRADSDAPRARRNRAAGAARGKEGAVEEADADSRFRGQLKRLLQLIPNLRLVEVRTRGEGAAEVAPPPQARIRALGRDALLELVYVTTNEPPWEVRLEAGLAGLLEPLLDRRLFDDLAVLDAQGRCLLQLGDQGLRVAALPLSLGASFRTNLTDLAGQDHLVFAQPVAPGFDGDSREGRELAEGTTTGDQWLLCGIIEADRFQSQTLKLDYEVIVLVVSLAVLLVVSWPLLDWSSVAPGGGVTKLRLASVAWVSVLLFGLLTTFLLDQLGKAQLRHELDQQLGDLAAEMQEHFGRELDGVIAQLATFHRRFTEKDPKAASPAADNLVTGLLAQKDFLEWDQLRRNPCPFFEMVFWADPQGQQQAKWTVRERTTPLIAVSQRDYFRTIVNGVPWVRAHPSATDLYGRPQRPGERVPVGQPFAVQSIYSWNTSENLAILSIPWDRADGSGIAAIDVRFLSLFDPVIAGGFGFCVVDAEGRVAFHSDPRRNLRENFIEECNRDARLRAAISGRTTDTFGVNYLLAPHRVRVTPIQDTPWMLVVFRDERMLDAARLQITSSTGVLLLVYVLWLGGVTAVLPWLGRRAKRKRFWAWLWPERRLAGDYAVVARMTFLVLAFGFTLGVVGSRGVLLASAFLLPTLALVATAAYLRRRDPGTAGEADSPSASVGVPPTDPCPPPRPVNADPSLDLSGSRGTATSARALLELPPPSGSPMAADADVPGRTPPAAWEGCLGGRSCYLVAAVGLLLLLAVFPAIACFKAVYDAEIVLMIRDSQLDLAQDYRSRREQIEQRVRELPFAPPRALDRADGTNLTSTEHAAQLGETRRQAFLDLRRGLDLDRYAGFFYQTRVQPSSAEARTSAHPPSPWFTWLDRFRVPYGDREALRARVAPSVSPSRPWSWGFDCGEEVLVWEGWEPRGAGARSLEIRSALRGWPQVPLWSAAVLWPLLGLLGVPVLAWWVLALLARRYLLLDAGRDTEPEQLRPSGWYLLLGPPAAGKTDWLATPDSGFTGPDIQHLDLRRPADRARLGSRAQKNLHTDPNRPMVIDHFEFGSDDPELTQRKLTLLRDLIATNRRGVVVVSNLHPLHFARVSPGDDQVAAAKSDAERHESWVDVLSLLRRIDKGPSENPSLEPRLDTVMLRRQRFKPLWDLCTDAEREILHHLACGRLVRSDCPEVASLIRRGLLKATPMLALTEPRFAAFVRRNYRPTLSRLGTDTKTGDWWQALRGPTLTLVAFGALFFFLTQPERWNQMLALAAAFVSGFGVLKDLTTRARFASGKSAA